MERIGSRLGRRPRAARRGAGGQVPARGRGGAPPLPRPDADDLQRRVHAGAPDRPAEAGRGAGRRARRRGEQKARHQPAAVPLRRAKRKILGLTSAKLYGIEAVDPGAYRAVPKDYESRMTEELKTVLEF